MVFAVKEVPAFFHATNGTGNGSPKLKTADRDHRREVRAAVLQGNVLLRTGTTRGCLVSPEQGCRVHPNLAVPNSHRHFGRKANSCSSHAHSKTQAVGALQVPYQINHARRASRCGLILVLGSRDRSSTVLYPKNTAQWYAINRHDCILPIENNVAWAG